MIRKAPKTQACTVCGTPFSPRARGGLYCSRTCTGKAKQNPDQVCVVCSKPFHATHGRKAQQTCSRSCGRVLAWQTSTAMPQNLQKARERLTTPEAQARQQQWGNHPRNPIYNPIIRAKAQTMAREKGYRHLVGGNGHLTIPQQLLAARLGWAVEVSIATQTGHSPYRYIADIAEPTLKIAIEIDGRSHQSAQGKQRDMEKEACLQALGWHVLRFSNTHVLSALNDVVATILHVVASITSQP